jgi:hypothetical protein
VNRLRPADHTVEMFFDGRQITAFFVHGAETTLRSPSKRSLT